jgi:hypothetical protein
MTLLDRTLSAMQGDTVTTAKGVLTCSREQRKRTVHFNAPFTLTGLEGVHPPGVTIRCRDDEEQIAGISWLAYRRVATMIEVVAGKKKSLIQIDPSDLDTALDKDRAQSGQKSLNTTH